MSDDKDPKEILLDIHKRVKLLEDELINDEPRFELEKGTKPYQILQYVKNNPGATLNNVQGANDFTDGSAELTRWYRWRLLDREKRDGVYHYELTPRGEVALQEAEDSGTSENDVGGSKGTSSLEPWEDAPISRCKWVAIHLVDEYDGRPETKELQDEYIEYGFESKKSLTSQVTRLHKDGYLVRTPWQPYKYDISEKGVGLLDKYGVDDIERYKE